MGKFVERPRYVEWKLLRDDDGKFDNANVDQAILMDIRETLNRLAALLDCPNFRSLPAQLRGLRNDLRREEKR